MQWIHKLPRISASVPPKGHTRSVTDQSQVDHYPDGTAHGPSSLKTKPFGRFLRARARSHPIFGSSEQTMTNSNDGDPDERNIADAAEQQAANAQAASHPPQRTASDVPATATTGSSSQTSSFGDPFGDLRPASVQQIDTWKTQRKSYRMRYTTATHKFYALIDEATLEDPHCLDEQYK